MSTSRMIPIQQLLVKADHLLVASPELSACCESSYIYHIVVMPFVTSSFLFLVAMPEAPSSEPFS